MSDSTVAQQYSRAMEVDRFAVGTLAALQPFGFTAENALSIVGVCRDEMMFPMEHALHQVWGSAFDMSSLAAMVFLGRSGLSAAAHHAPGADGRKRFVNVVMPHIGLDSDGTSGVVMRAGQTGPSTACGALIGLLEQLRSGRYANDLDWDDVEMSLVAMLLSGHVGHDHDLDLWGLTDLARRVATGEIVRLSADLLECADTDVAVFSCVLIHGPEGDRVVVHEASAWLGSNSERVTLVVE